MRPTCRRCQVTVAVRPRATPARGKVQGESGCPCPSSCPSCRGARASADRVSSEFVKPFKQRHVGRHVLRDPNQGVYRQNKEFVSMRKYLLAALLAGVAVAPAMAQEAEPFSGARVEGVVGYDTTDVEGENS